MSTTIRTSQEVEFMLNEVVNILRQVYVAKSTKPELINSTVEDQLDDIHDKISRINNKRYT